MRRLFKLLIYGRWTVRRCGWPYEYGYATYHSRSMTLLDTGLTKDYAQALCVELNENPRRIGGY